MRIAYLNNHYQLGGAETVVRQLHRGMLERKISSKILVTEAKSLPRGNDVVSLYPLLLGKLDHSRLRGYVNRFVARRDWTDHAVLQLAKSRYDLIHVHSFHGLYASLNTFSRLVEAKPVIWTFHRFWGVTGGCDHPFDCVRYHYGCGSCPQVGNFAVGPVDNTSREWEDKMQLLSDLPLTIVAPSQHLAEVVRRSPIGKNWKTVVIHNGINTKDFGVGRKQDSNFRATQNLKPGKTSLLFTNRNFRDPIKGWPTIREALKLLSPQGLQLMLVGDGSSWAASQLSPDWDIIDYGYVNDRQRMACIYEAADIFLYASEGENFPCAILEAMSSGCCIVSTPVDGVLEQIESGHTGVVAEKNDGKSLANCLSLALQDPNHIKQIGRAARIKASSTFSEELMLDKHLDLYRSVLQSRSD
jgi:glycosyltransferase involved in cell wall biosynthesis